MERSNITRQLIDYHVGAISRRVNEAHTRALASGVNNGNFAWADSVSRNIFQTGIQAEAVARLAEAAQYENSLDKSAAQALEVGIGRIEWLIKQLEDQRALFTTFVAEAAKNIQDVVAKVTKEV